MSIQSTSALILSASHAQANEYFDLFINRKTHVQQSTKPNKKGRHYFYKVSDRETKEPIGLTPEIVRSHLAGRRTIGFYASSPTTQTSKWIAIDADYSDAIDDPKRPGHKGDLTKLCEAFAADGVVALPENSRRGGHLWIFFETPLPSELCRRYVLHLANTLGIPIKQGEEVPGLELFPRQNLLLPDEYGNAMRGPLGVHRTCMQRFWFKDAKPNLAAQFELLRNVPKLTAEELNALTSGLALIPDRVVPPQSVPITYRAPGGNSNRFDILRELRTQVRRNGKNFNAECPSCHKKPLSINAANPDLYRCWHGCTKEMIREALGCPINYRVPVAA